MIRIKLCPVTACGALILDHATVCIEDWLRLPDSMKDELQRLHKHEKGSVEHQAAIVEAVAYLSWLPPLASRPISAAVS